jgi:integrase
MTSASSVSCSPRRARAGLPPVRLHDLRPTAASLLIAQNVPARLVMEILGYNQIALTMNTYSHVAPEVSRAATDRLSWGFSGQVFTFGSELR